MSIRRTAALLRAAGAPDMADSLLRGPPHRVTRAPMRLQHLLRNGLAAARVRAGNRRLIRSSLAGSTRRAARMMSRGLMGALGRARARIAARRSMQPRGAVMLRRRQWAPGTARRLF